MSDSEGSSNDAPVYSPVPEATDPASEKDSVADEQERSRHSAQDSSIKSPSASPHSDGEDVKSESNERAADKEEEKNSERDVEDSAKEDVGETEVLSVGDKSEHADDSRDDQANESKEAINDSDNDEDGAGPSKRRRVVMSSDDEDDGASSNREKGSESGGEQQGEAGVGELMTNIFGEESDDEGEPQQSHQTNKDDDDDEPRFVREDDGEDDYGKVWDFDEMLSAKKAERKQKRRRKDGSIDIGNDADEQIRMLAEAMKAAAKDDRHSNMERKPALQKRKMLRYVKAMLIKRDLMEAIIDDGMLSAVSEWLAPLPDKSLPALEIRTDLLKILQDYTRLEQGTLKQCGLGRAVMLLYKHPKETKANKTLAHNLISEWARPIFQLETDYNSMTKEERMQRDYSQMSEAKRQQLGNHDNTDEEKEPEPRVYDKGFINRARVPRPSQKDYVVRPKSNVDGQFRGASKNRQNSRYDKTQRDFKERTKKSRSQRALGVSIEGRKMDI